MTSEKQMDSEERKADGNLTEAQAQIEEFMSRPTRENFKARARHFAEQKKKLDEERKQERRDKERAVLQGSPYAFKLYDKDDLSRRLEEAASQRDGERLKLILTRMATESCIKYLAPQPANFESILDELQGRYPHFATVTAFLRSRMRLNGLKPNPVLDFNANLLLLGEAGCGKSSFLFELGKRFDTQFKSIACASVTNGFDLTGLSSGWGNGKVGDLHTILVEQACPNPIVLLDEIDKTAEDDGSSPFKNTLYQLLEPNNAKRLKDEFVGVEMDASRINWVASANNVEVLDAPIRDRFEIIKVPAPTVADLRIIVPHLYEQQLSEYGLQEVFDPDIAPRIVEQMVRGESASIRRLKSIINTALANAAGRAGKTNDMLYLEASDVPEMANERPTTRIGFI